MIKQALSKLFVTMIVIGVVMMAGALLVLRSSAADAPDPTQVEEIQHVMTRAYQLLDTPFDRLNLDQLSEVFIDHPDYVNELDTATQAKLQSQITEVLERDASHQWGYLTAITSQITYRQRGINLLRSALAKAASERRELSEEEWQDLTRQNGGHRPALPNLDLVDNQRELIYKSVEIDGDKARVVHDDGITYRTAILVRIDGRWYVAGIF